MEIIFIALKKLPSDYHYKKSFACESKGIRLNTYISISMVKSNKKRNIKVYNKKRVGAIYLKYMQENELKELKKKRRGRIFNS